MLVSRIETESLLASQPSAQPFIFIIFPFSRIFNRTFRFLQTREISLQKARYTFCDPTNTQRMPTLSREAARVLVGKIKEDNGGISPEDRAACPPAALRALKSVCRKLGSATKTYKTPIFFRVYYNLEAAVSDIFLEACNQSPF